MGQWKLKVGLPLCFCLSLIVLGGFLLVSLHVMELLRGLREEEMQLFEEELPSRPVFGHAAWPNCWLVQNRTSCAPQFIVAGSMKSGTTSVYSYLKAHPRVLPLHSFSLDPGGTRLVVSEKEVRFFNDPHWSAMLREYGQDDSVSYYLNLFPAISPNSSVQHITGEATPLYLSQPGVARRISDVLPEIKIILLLRKPLERAYSEFWFKQSLTGEGVSDKTFDQLDLSYESVFEQCLKAEMNLIDLCRHQLGEDSGSVVYASDLHRCIKTTSHTLATIRDTDRRCKQRGAYHSLCVPRRIRGFCVPGNVWNSLYGYQLREWVLHFPSRNLLVIPSEHLFYQPARVMEQMTTFLGVNTEAFDWEQATQKTFNIDGQKAGPKPWSSKATSSPEPHPPLSPELEEELSAWFAPFARLLPPLYRAALQRAWKEHAIQGERR